MSANERQVGGDHYRTPIQHWDYVLANDIPYLEAQVIKYLTRWRKKGGHQDLRKARHFLDKLLEVEGVDPQPLPTTGGTSLQNLSAVCVNAGRVGREEAEQERQLLGDDDRLNSAVFDRVRERATVERELENDEPSPLEKFQQRKKSEPNWP